jgi:hypothetical protein
MDTFVFSGEPDRLSRLELVSLYINEFNKLDPELKAKFEAAFRKRKLPLPDMAGAPPAQRVPPGKRSSIDKGTFFSYILLIYSGTAVFYSWIYLAQRLVKMDFGENTKHKLVQTAIALAYVVGEILLYDYFAHRAD